MSQYRIDARTVAITAVIIAIVTVFTVVVRIPIPATEGYFSFADVAIFFAAFAFGPWVGMVAGGVGTALADVIGGFPQFAVLSFLAHGTQGLIAGFIGGRQETPRMFLGWLFGTMAMVGIYFLGEALVLTGLGPALTEVPFNLVQCIAGAVVGIPLTLAVRRAYPPIRTIGAGRTWKEM